MAGELELTTILQTMAIKHGLLGYITSTGPIGRLSLSLSLTVCFLFPAATALIIYIYTYPKACRDGVPTVPVQLLLEMLSLQCLSTAIDNTHTHAQKSTICRLFSHRWNPKK